jgi:hypothetical protein
VLLLAGKVVVDGEGELSLGKLSWGNIRMWCEILWYIPPHPAFLTTLSPKS